MFNGLNRSLAEIDGIRVYGKDILMKAALNNSINDCQLMALI